VYAPSVNQNSKIEVPFDMEIPAYILKLMVAALVSASIATSCALVEGENIPAPDPAITSRVSSATGDFGFRLLNALAKDPAQNTIISPLGVATAFAMAYNGAAGATKTEMAKTLGLGSLSDDDINRANHYLMHTLTQADPTVQTEIANALWAQKDFPINPDFSNVCESFYDASAASLDFVGDPTGAAAEINAWVDKNTHHRIPVLVKEVDRSTRLMLTDAVYFKGIWSSKFKKEQTRPRPFHLMSGDSHQTSMMEQSGTYAYLENQDFQAIRMPYGNLRYAMYVFLPRKTAGLPDFIRSLDETHWKQWTSQFRQDSGEIVLPKFETTYSKKLNGTLQDLGMRSPFDPRTADFSRIPLNPTPGTRLHISDVEHKTWVKVDEEGTEAAAATSIRMGVALAVGARMPSFVMIVDHPFFFAITEQQSGALLFAGVVMDPTLTSGAS
jgi:serpin B